VAEAPTLAHWRLAYEPSCTGNVVDTCVVVNQLFAVDNYTQVTYIVGMDDKMLQIRVSEELLNRIDRWRLTQGLPVLSRAQAIRNMIERVLDEDEPKN
jgi:hypothetical protein